MSFLEKVILPKNLNAWREQVRQSGRKLVVTNGCFDILHLGHVTYLQDARQAGDALLVGVNADISVRQLKGPHRPVNCESDRASVLAALESVTAVSIFEDKTATRFLAQVQPDIYVKGGDYTIETINQEERRTVESAGGKVLILPIVPGKSTTDLLRRIASL